MEKDTKFKKGMTPWNKGLKGYNKGHPGYYIAFGKDNHFFGKKHTDEFKKKQSNRLKKEYSLGKISPRWISDRSLIKISDRKFNDPLQKNWRMEVKKRDNFRCKISDNNCNGRLEVHHILRWSEFPELRYDINNGITLCKFHHPLKKEEETRLSPYFMELIKQ